MLMPIGWKVLYVGVIVLWAPVAYTVLALVPGSMVLFVTAWTAFVLRHLGMERHTQKPRVHFSIVPDRHLLGVFLRVYWRDSLKFCSCIALKEGINMLIPMLLRLMVQFVADESRGALEGLIVALYLGVANLVLCFATHAPMVASGNIGFKMRATLMAIVFRKSLCLSSAARHSFTSGEIVNLMANDASRFVEFTNMLNDVALCVPFLIISLTLVYSMLGQATYAGVLVLVFGMTINAALVKRLKILRAQQMGQTDHRVLQINEALHGIRAVKANCWEEPIAARIGVCRAREVERIRSVQRIQALLKFNAFAIPVMLALVTFTLYAAWGGVMRAEDIFTVLALFSMVQQYMNMLPNALGTLGQLLVSQGRLERFLRAPEQLQGGAHGVLRLPRSSTIDGCANAAGEVYVHGANFYWGSATAVRPNLHNIDFHAEPGQLVCIVGAIGSGKSSLIAACLGAMTREGGTHTLRGNAALCSQQPWLESGTLRDNVLMGKPFEKSSYWEAIRKCGLIPDLEQLPEGDKTAIGNQGINLSGGQKQRIALARAVYQTPDIVFLDDVLAAVDVHVANQLFEDCIRGAFNQTTRVLVTNALQYASRCDRCYVVADGAIVETGVCRTLLADSESRLAALVGGTQYREQQTASNDDHPDLTEKEPVPLVGLGSTPQAAACAQEGKTALQDGTLTIIEKRRAGTVMLNVYSRWLRAGSGPSALLVMFLGGFFGSELLNLLAQLWVAQWSADAPGDATQDCTGSDSEALRCTEVSPTHPTSYYTTTYAILSLGACLAVLVGNLLWTSSVVRAAAQLHAQLLMNVLRLPTIFFDRTPTGRIINRFASDIDMLDTAVSDQVLSLITCLLKGTFAMVVTATVLPILCMALLLLWPPYMKIRELFRRSDRELRRLDSTTRSPIFAHFSEHLAGVQTLRAFDRVEQAVSKNQSLLGTNLQTAFHQRQVHGWVSLRLDLVGTALTLAAAISCVLFRHQISPSICGLMLFQLTQAIRYYRWVRASSTTR
jgi:ATP-binding cassette subfamily C (CFTR/MRP) protein 1